MDTRIGSLPTFAEVITQRHDYARQWKERTGGKVVGYLCTYVPEEVLHAAGILPVRLLGGHEPQDVTESHIFSMFCAYCRDVLAQGLLGRYPYLDGLAFSHCCPHIRQTYESWRSYLPLSFTFLSWVPGHTQSQAAYDFFLAATRELKQGVEDWLGRPISPQALREAIEVYNLNRRLLARVFQSRQLHPPPLSGTQAMEMAVSSALMDKREHNQLLKEFLAQPPGPGRPGVRLLTLGSENDDVELIRFIETLGAVVVAEDNCLTNRYFQGEVSLNGDMLSALTARYLAKPPCPLRDIDKRRRADYILDLARQFQVQGVLFLRQKFCDPHAFEIPVIQRRLQEAGFPSLALELDITVPYGQFRTRTEAFLEMLT